MLQYKHAYTRIEHKYKIYFSGMQGDKNETTQKIGFSLFSFLTPERQLSNENPRD